MIIFWTIAKSAVFPIILVSKNKRYPEFILYGYSFIDCVYRQWFLEVFLGLFSNVNDVIMPMSDAVSSEGRRPQASNEGSCLLRTEISPVSLNLLMMLCTVDEICKAFEIEEHCFLKYSTIFYALFHRLESLCPSLLLRDSASLRHHLYS